MKTKSQINDGRLASRDDAELKTPDETKHIELELLADAMNEATTQLLVVRRYLEDSIEYSFPESFDIDRWVETGDRFEEALDSCARSWKRWVKRAAEGVND